MRTFIETIDRISQWVGHAFAWCIMAMALGIGYEVFVRYVLHDPTAWAFDLSYIMYGTLFMMGGAYTLSRDGHVRGDVLFRLWPARVQATVELLLYLLFFFPAVLALMFAGWKFAYQSWGYREVSINSPAGVPIFHFKMIIPAAGLLLLLQGFAQVARCIVCLKTGQWPGHLTDVEEMEDALRAEEERRRQRAEAEAAGNGGRA